MAKVVILTPYYHPILGGVETHAAQLAGWLRDLGVSVGVLTKEIDASTPRTDVVDGIPVVRVPPRGPRRGAAKWLMVPAALCALLRRHRTWDVVVCPDIRGVALPALIAARLLGRSVVFEAATPGALTCDNWNSSLARAGITPDGWLGRLMKWPMRRIYGAADAYACISHEIEAETRHLAKGAADVAYLPHAVDLTKFRLTTSEKRLAARRALGLSPSARVVVFVGRLSNEKGVADLVAAWRQVQVEDAQLVLVGPDMPGHPLDAGPMARQAAALAGSRIWLAGSAGDVRPFLAAADVFVQPSHYEAFGISVIEALASGVPVVASRVGGMAEFLEQERNALLCTPRDAGELAAALNRILSDEALAARLAAAGRNTVEQNFDGLRIALGWQRLIETALLRRGSRPHISAPAHP